MAHSIEIECSRGLKDRRVGKRGLLGSQRRALGTLQIEVPQHAQGTSLKRVDLTRRSKIGTITIEWVHIGNVDQKSLGTPKMRIVPDSPKGPASNKLPRIPVGSGKYVFPVQIPFHFRGTFGDPRRYRKGGKGVHKGTDIYGAIGQEIYAITSGTLYLFGSSDINKYRYGLGLLLKGDDGNRYKYLHVDRYAKGVVTRKKVKAGELIAYLGRTGIKSSPAHLHFDYKVKGGGYQDPWDLLVNILGLVGHFSKDQVIRVTGVKFKEP